MQSDRDYSSEYGFSKKKKKAAEPGLHTSKSARIRPIQCIECYHFTYLSLA